MSLKYEAGESGGLSPRTLSQIDKMEKYIDDLDLIRAEKVAKDLLEREPQNPDVMVAVSKCYIDLEKDGEARNLLQKAVAMKPDRGWEKYCCYAQLLEGNEALTMFRKAAELMLRDHPEDVKKRGKTATVKCILSGEDMPEDDEEDDPEKPRLEELRDVYLSMSEVYLSDIWEEPSSKEECHKVLSQAMQLSPDDKHVLQSMAAYHLSCGTMTEAAEHLQSSIDKWYPQYKELKAAADENKSHDLLMLLDDAAIYNIVPDYEFRCDTVKFLIDLDKLEQAETLCDEIIAGGEDSYLIYMMKATIAQKRDDPETQKEYIEKAMCAACSNGDLEDDEREILLGDYEKVGGNKEELLKKVKEIIDQQNEEDEEDDEDASSDEDQDPFDADADDDDDDDDDDDETDDEDIAVHDAAGGDHAAKPGNDPLRREG